MKNKNLLLILVLGLFIASCTDKKAAAELEKMKIDMRKADSICNADKTMLMDSIAMMQMQMDSLMMPKNSTGSSSKSNTSTKTTTTTGDKSVNDRGNKTEVDKSVNDRGKTEEVKKDVNKRGGN